MLTPARPRASRIRGVVLVLLLSVAGMLLATPAQAADDPPVLLVGVTGVRWDDVTTLTTPALWSLSREGSIGLVAGAPHDEKPLRGLRRRGRTDQRKASGNAEKLSDLCRIPALGEAGGMNGGQGRRIGCIGRSNFDRRTASAHQRRATAEAAWGFASGGRR